MKKSILLLTASALLAGCASTPSTSPNIGTRGLLICQPNELCPIVTVSWNEAQPDQFSIRVSLNSNSTKYDIEKIIFSNSQQQKAFLPKTATEYDYVLGAYRSRNTISVPVNMAKEFGKASNIFMTVVTDKGDIKQYVLKDGIESSLYQQLQEAHQQVKQK